MTCMNAACLTPRWCCKVWHHMVLSQAPVAAACSSLARLRMLACQRKVSVDTDSIWAGAASHCNTLQQAYQGIASSGSEAVNSGCWHYELAGACCCVWCSVSSSQPWAWAVRYNKCVFESCLLLCLCGGCQYQLCSSLSSHVVLVSVHRHSRQVLYMNESYLSFVGRMSLLKCI